MITKIQNTLAAKIIVFLGIILVGMLSVITFFNFNAQKKILLERGLKEANDLGDSILTGIRYPMIEGDQDIIQLHFEHFRELSGIRSIHLLDHNGVIKRSTELNMLEKKAESELTQKALAGYPAHGIKDFRNSGKKIFVEAIPIPNEPSCYNCHGQKYNILGVLEISLDWEPVLASIHKARDLNIMFSIAALVGISLSVIFIILRVVVNPVQVVEQGLQKVSEGDLSHKLPVTRDDEIGSVSKMFNKMTSDINTFMNREKELRRAEQLKSRELEESLSLINATLESTADGILVVSKNRKVTRYNRQFADIWQVDEAVFRQGDEVKVLEAASKLTENPEQFVKDIENIYAEPDLESAFTIDFKDGRIIDIVSRPQKIGFNTVGRVWSCRDITDQKRTEQALQSKMSELERFNRFVVGREIKMKELKEHIYELREQIQQSKKTGEEQ